MGILDARVEQMISVMRADGDKFPNLGVAYERLENRKKVESRTLAPEEVPEQQINNAVNSIKEIKL